jgi:hypothetical protein
MGKTSLTLAVVCLFGVFTAMAQDNSSAASQNAQQGSYSQSTTTTTSSQSTSTDNSGQTSNTPTSSTQSAMSNGATQTSNGEQTVEGCLIHEQTSYYIQPESGGTRVQLSPSRSLDSYVGQHVRVSGHNGSASGDSSSAVSSGGPSDLSGGMLTVTGVKTISGTCSPAGGGSQQ